MRNKISTISNVVIGRCSAALLTLFTVLLVNTSALRAQVLTYSQSFTQSATSTTQCNAWETFRASLLVYSYTSVSITAGSTPATITCTNPTIVADIALCLRTGVSRTWTDGSNIWNVGTCGSGGSPTVTGWELSVNNGNCLCSSGYCARPCIGNLNWGGQGTTCSAPSQTITVEFNAGPPCPIPTNVTITAVYSSAVFFTWTPPTGSNGSEFIVDQNATGPTGNPTGTITTNTTASQGGLTPSTTYYLHVRNRCDSPSKSVWVTTSFTTLPPCIIPPSIKIPQIDTNSATIQWATITPAILYQYFIKDNNTPPTTDGSSSTTSNQVQVSALDPGKTYYIFLRAKCLGGDSSAWVLDSFYVPIPCRAPSVQFNDLNSERVVAFWNTPATAYEYDILNSSVQLTTPTAGIKKSTNSYLFPYLDPNTTYYVYARSYCDDHNIKSISPWAETMYKTWALAVGDVEMETNSVSVLPNPVTNQMVVTITGKVGADANVTVMDVSGRALKTIPANSKKITVNMTEFPAGVYVLQYADDARREQVRFNKQ